MIDPDKRKAVYFLHKQGMGVREISRHMSISTNTVMTIIGQAGEMPETERKDKIKVVGIIYGIAIVLLCIFGPLFMPLGIF